VNENKKFLIVTFRYDTILLCNVQKVALGLRSYTFLIITHTERNQTLK